MMFAETVWLGGGKGEALIESSSRSGSRNNFIINLLCALLKCVLFKFDF